MFFQWLTLICMLVVVDLSRSTSGERRDLDAGAGSSVYRFEPRPPIWISNRSDMDIQLKAASQSLDKSEGRTFSKFERTLDAAGDKAGRGGVNVSTDNITAGVHIIEDQLSTWAQASKALVGLLDEAEKLHPFIGVAVIAFKIGLNMELEREENDRRILALHLVMRDMMSKLLIIRKLDYSHSGSDEKTIEDLLSLLIGKIAEDIQDFTNTCDAYYKQRFIVKFYKSHRWADKLSSFSDCFADHKLEIQSQLTIRTNFKQDDAEKYLQSISASVKTTNELLSMSTLLNEIRSPREKEIMAWINENGGVNTVKRDDSLFKQLVSMTEKGATQRDEKVLGRLATSLRADIRADSETEFNKFIDGNRRLFDQKFADQKRDIREISDIVQKQGDRIYTAIIEGPYDRLADSDLKQIWKDMRWRGSVKARHLILALRDYFIDAMRSSGQTVKAIGKLTTSDNSTDTDSDRLAKISAIYQETQAHHVAQDSWAFQYISLMRIQPLMEAFDDDVSGFVTVKEVNEFTSSRPQDWSLPRWLAYWAVGYEMSLHHYCHRICEMLTKVHYYAEKTLPENRAYVDRYVHNLTTVNIDAIVAGLMDYEWDSELWEKFKAFIDSEERRIKVKLENFSYNIDASNSLSIIVGSGRLEKNLLVLVSLLLERHCEILNLSGSVILHRDELLVPCDSLLTVWSEVQDRVDQLRAVFKHQNLDEEKMLQKSVHGLFSCFSQWDPTAVFRSKFYNNNEFNYEGIRGDGDGKDIGEDEDEGELQDPLESNSSHSVDQTRGSSPHIEVSVSAEISENDGIIPLAYGPQDDKLDTTLYEDEYNFLNVNLATGIVGFWSGFYSYNVNVEPGHMEFFVTRVADDGAFFGEGTDVIGPFAIKGKLFAAEPVGTWTIRFRKVYTHYTENGRTISWRYEGALSTVSNGEISGRWGSDQNELVDDFHSEHLTVSAGLGGLFELSRHPLNYYLDRPSESDFQTNRSRALWKFAISSTLRSVRKETTYSWDELARRRDLRKRFIFLLISQIEDGSNWMLHSGVVFPLTWEMWDELQTLTKTIHPRDIRFYYSLAYFMLRRRVYHLLSCNLCESFTSIVHTRFLCIDCLKPATLEYTMDICESHIKETYSSQAEDIHHVLSHVLLQLRRALAMRRTRAVARKAKAKVEDVRNSLEMSKIGDQQDKASINESLVGPGPFCSRCKCSLSVPCWVCVDCDDNVFLCDRCNTKDNAEKPWLRQKNDLSQEGHSYFHALAMCPCPPVPTEPSTEERVARMESRLYKVQDKLVESDSKINARLDQLEKMLGQILQKQLDE